MTQLPSKPAMRIRDAINELLQANSKTNGAEVAEMYLGTDIFVARLRRPQVVEGDWADTERTVDLFDLMQDRLEQEGVEGLSRLDDVSASASGRTQDDGPTKKQ